MAALSLLLIMLTDGIRCLKQLYRSYIFAHQYIAQMLCKACHEVSRIKTFHQHLIEQQQGIAHIASQCRIHQAEIIIRIQHIQHRDRLLIANRCSAERHQLIEDTQRITHTAIRFLCHHVQCLFARIHAFLLGNILQVTNGISHRNTTKVIHLTTAQDGRQHFVLLGCRQDKDSI